MALALAVENNKNYKFRFRRESHSELLDYVNGGVIYDRSFAQNQTGAQLSRPTEAERLS